MKLDEALKQARARLGNKLSSALDARLLMQEATGLAHADLVADPQRELSETELARFTSMIGRRLAHEPVSRILGRREFYGRNFVITPEVLDPRPDTEIVVELALKHLRQGRFVDLGTGSGAIAVTLCAEAPELEGVATDISAKALAVARKNATVHGVEGRLRFHHGSWTDGLEGPLDLVISNPPYIRAGEMLMPEVQNHDPHVALFAGPDGLQAYRAIAAVAPSLLAPDGRVLVEIGAGQRDDVAAIFSAEGLMPQDEAEDLQGHIRGLLFGCRKPA